jgi:hypothetical protein
MFLFSINYILKINCFFFLIKKFYLPKFYGNTSLYNPGSKPVISIEIQSQNNTKINHKINVEFEIDESNEIKDIIIDINFNMSKLKFIDETNFPIIDFDLDLYSTITKLKPIDSIINKSITDYEFILVNQSEYLDVDIRFFFMILIYLLIIF